MKAICTYCSAKKDTASSLLPAIKRYRSARIEVVNKIALSKSRIFIILSGKFGLLESSWSIPFYDHLLNNEEITHHAQIVAQQLKDLKISELDYYTRSPELDCNIIPYFDCIKLATNQSKVSLVIHILPE